MTAQRSSLTRSWGAKVLLSSLGVLAVAVLVRVLPAAMTPSGGDPRLTVAASGAPTPSVAALRAARSEWRGVVRAGTEEDDAHAVGSGDDAGGRSQAPATGATDPAQLLERVKANLRRERELLLEYAYRERRRAIKVSPFGKVSVGDEELYEVYPSSDPDVPRRVLVAVNGRPLTPEEQAAWLASHGGDGREEGPRARQDRLRREAEARRKAQERFEDAFRVFRFELGGQEMLDGRLARLVLVRPRPEARTVSDAGRWMKKFEGRAWVSEAEAELLRLELVAVDTIWIGLGIVGRVHQGTRLTYIRRPAAGGVWFPAHARIQARGRTLLFRSFEVDSATEWFDYRRHEPDRPSGHEVRRPTDPARVRLRI